MTVKPVGQIAIEAHDARKRLDAISREQAALDDANDKLQARIARLEEHLAAILHTRVEITCENTETKFTRLSFGRYDQAWCFQIEQGGTFIRLTTASQEIRSEAFAGGHVRMLIEKVLPALQDRRKKRELAIVAAEDLTALLGGNS